MIKKKQTKYTFYVYSILYRNKMIYVGHTNDIVIRQKQHNYLYKKGNNKPLYNYLRQVVGFDQKIELIVIGVYESRVEAKRREMFIILTDYFDKKKLKQKVPSIGR